MDLLLFRRHYHYVISDKAFALFIASWMITCTLIVIFLYIFLAIAYRITKPEEDFLSWCHSTDQPLLVFMGFGFSYISYMIFAFFFVMGVIFNLIKSLL